MKVQLEPIERKALYALLKLVAVQYKDTDLKQAMFWNDLAMRLKPSEKVAEIRRREAELLLEMGDAAVTSLTKRIEQTSNAEDARIRGEVLKDILNKAKQKIHARINELESAGNEAGSRTEEADHGIQTSE